MKNYEVTFKSLRTGTTYKVTIGGGTGTAVALKGAASPLMTSEDTSDDMFEPIRTTTGYLRIEDDGYAADGVTAFNWKDLIPETDLSRPVAVTADGVTVWQGYLQAQDFGSTLYGNPQARDYPVMCPLAALSASMVDTTERQMRNFAYLMLQAFDSLPGIDIDRFVIQGGAQAREWLLKLVDWQGMLEVGSEGVTARYSNYEALSSMCQFWGWTCRYKGSTVYLTCVDDEDVTGWLTLTYSQLATLAGGESAGTVTADGYDSVVVDGGFASVDNEERLARGYSKIVVESDGGENDGEVIEAFPPSVENEMKNMGGYGEIDGDKYIYYSNDLLSFNDSLLSGQCVEDYASFNLATIQSSDLSNYNEEQNNVVRIKHVWTQDMVMASFVTKFAHSFYDPTAGGILSGANGGIVLRGDIYLKSVKYESISKSKYGNGSMKMKLGIGKTRATAMWWDGNEWSSTETSFYVAVGNTDGIFYSKYTTTPRQSVSYRQYIPTNNRNLSGLMFVDFLGSDDEVTHSHLDFISNYLLRPDFDVVNFSVNFALATTSRRSGKINRAETRQYKATNQNKCQDNNDTYLNFASDNEMEWGFSVLSSTTGERLGKQTYGSNEEWAEQHLADRMADYWRTSKRVLDVDLLARDIAPTDIVTIDGGTYYPVSIRQEWRDDITRVMMLEI